MTTLTHDELQQIIDAAAKATGWDRISIDATHAEHLARIALAAAGFVSKRKIWLDSDNDDTLSTAMDKHEADVKMCDALRDAGLIK